MKTLSLESWIAAVLGAVMLSSCFGSMNASRRIKTWNREIENRWLGEGVFLVLRYLPIYSLAFVGDVLIFNSIEFWGGEHPIDPPSPERLQRLSELDAKRHG